MSKTKNRQSREQIAQMVGRAFNGASLADIPNAIIEMEDGWFNAVYTIRLADQREVILKVAPPADVVLLRYEVNIMATEVEMMRLVAQNPEIPVPQVYYYDSTHELCDADYFFMEKLDGVDLEVCKATFSPESVAQVDQHIGRIMRALHQITGSYFGYPGNPDLRAETWPEAFIKIVDAILQDGIDIQVDYYGIPVETIRAVVTQNADALAAVTVPRLIHWDGWDKNFFAKDDRIIGLIDFERALWGDPLMEDQFRTPVLWGVVTEAMKGYGKTEFTHDELRRCHLYALHLGLVMKTEGYYRDYEDANLSQIAQNLVENALRWLTQAG